MVPAGSDHPQALVLARLRALPAGARLLDALDAPPSVTGAYLVGGAVRDLLRGCAPHELDVAVEGAATPVARLLAARLGGEARHHDTFGTATVEGAGALRVDLAQARTERYVRPGALPEVAPAERIEDDLARRDFTVNAIAVGVSADRRGTLVAVPGALEDLEAGVLRVLHSGSFVDDPTRLVRMVRYAVRLGAVVAPETEALARAAFAAGAPATAGAARMGRELLLLLREPDPVAGLELLRALGGAEDLDVDPEVLRAVVPLVPAGEDPARALLAALTRRQPAGERRAWLEAIHVPDPGDVDAAAGGAEALAGALRSAGAPSEVHRLLRRQPVEAVVLAGALGAEEAARAWLGGLRDVTLDITGDDLLAHGIARGPEIGARLDAALRAKLDGHAPTRAEQLTAALTPPP